MKLLLDECISPNLKTPLWMYEVDTDTLRDRGLLGKNDWTIWNLAQSEHRTVVTHNYGDFRRLATESVTHEGLIVIPSGNGRDSQLTDIMKAVNWAKVPGDKSIGFNNTIVTIAETGELTAEMTSYPENMVPFRPRIVS